MIQFVKGCWCVCAACASAYNGEATATAACQRGCKLELPAVQNRLRQVSTEQFVEQSRSQHKQHMFISMHVCLHNIDITVFSIVQSFRELRPLVFEGDDTPYRITNSYRIS